MKRFLQDLKASEKKRLFVVSLVFLMVSIVFVRFVTQEVFERIAKEQKHELESQVSLVRANIEAAIFMDTYLADSLAMIVTINPELALKEWHSISEKVLTKAQYVRNMGIAPNDILSNVYPLEGNERAIGLDFRTRPEQYASVLNARELGRVHITGPVNLVQGGKAIIARYPIFTDFPLNQDYWGGVSIVFDYQSMLTAVGIRDIRNAYVTLSKGNTILYGDGFLDKPDIQLPIHLPNSKWRLEAKADFANNLDVTRYTMLACVSAISLCVMAYVIAFLMFRGYTNTRRHALQDELTHISNRRHAIQYIRNTLNSRTKPPFSLFSIDLNGFKKVNDTYGHNIGDEYLKFVAEGLASLIRETDLVARIGGDEFIIVLIDVHKSGQVKAVLDKIERYFATHPFIANDIVLYVSVAIGVAIASDRKATLDDLLVQADEEMYQDKYAKKQART
ncbi:diguanylate cyclase [Vibrio zhugei]|uniref:Diguanylate cyclase n=1 Tax=Vibrio zhugei TaxID=2479546 RepID=A0ABV7CAJ1_9VIBR|nr:diguanylate cyclase [Vibrio zhugei]